MKKKLQPPQENKIVTILQMTPPTIIDINKKWERQKKTQKMLVRNKNKTTEYQQE